MPGRLFFDLLAQMSRVLAHGGRYLCVINDVNKGNTIGFAVTAGPIFICLKFGLVELEINVNFAMLNNHKS